MIATENRLHHLSRNPGDESFSNPGRPHSSEWHRVARCDTAESAQQLLRELQEHGVESAITMIDGLTVVAK